MKWYFILLIIAGAIFVTIVLSLIVSVTLYVIRHTVTPKKITSKEEYLGFFKDVGIDGWYKDLELSKIEFKMKDGYLIHGAYNQVLGSNKFVIISHGHTTNKEASLIYASIFNLLGYSVIIYDHRGHGDNEKAHITMGYQEAKDLKEIIDEVYNRFGQNIYLGLHGLSMGAATVMLVLKYTQNLKFVIEDCGYDDFRRTNASSLRKYHLCGEFFTPFIDLFYKLFFGFVYKDISPIRDLEKNKVPILFIHGEKDQIVPFDSMENLYNKATCYKEKKAFDSKHARSLVYNHDLYLETLRKFLENVAK